jgi:hypothetical protein
MGGTKGPPIAVVFPGDRAKALESQPGLSTGQPFYLRQDS